MDHDQLPWFTTFKLRRFIQPQEGDLVKIHLVAMATVVCAVLAETIWRHSNSPFTCDFQNGSHCYIITQELIKKDPTPLYIKPLWVKQINNLDPGNSVT